ncbi:unnamed protein product, partial [Laminaria digitata]
VALLKYGPDSRSSRLKAVSSTLVGGTVDGLAGRAIQATWSFCIRDTSRTAVLDWQPTCSGATRRGDWEEHHQPRSLGRHKPYGRHFCCEWSPLARAVHPRCFDPQRQYCPTQLWPSRACPQAALSSSSNSR